MAMFRNLYRSNGIKPFVKLTGVPNVRRACILVLSNTITFIAQSVASIGKILCKIISNNKHALITQFYIGSIALDPNVLV